MVGYSGEILTRDRNGCLGSFRQELLQFSAVGHCLCCHTLFLFLLLQARAVSELAESLCAQLTCDLRGPQQLEPGRRRAFLQQKHLAKALFCEYARACMSLVTMGAGYFWHWAAFVWGSLANDNACEMPGQN